MLKRVCGMRASFPANCFLTSVASKARSPAAHFQVCYDALDVQCSFFSLSLELVRSFFGVTALPPLGSTLSVTERCRSLSSGCRSERPVSATLPRHWRNSRIRTTRMTTRLRPLNQSPDLYHYSFINIQRLVLWPANRAFEHLAVQFVMALH